MDGETTAYVILFNHGKVEVPLGFAVEGAADRVRGLLTAALANATNGHAARGEFVDFVYRELGGKEQPGGVLPGGRATFATLPLVARHPPPAARRGTISHPHLALPQLRACHAWSSVRGRSRAQ